MSLKIVSRFEFLWRGNRKFMVS